MVKTIEQIYKKMKPEQHILEVSDTYVGSKELTEMDAYLLDNNRMN